VGKLIINLIVLSLFGCSTTHFKSKNTIVVSMDKNDEHTQDIEVKVDKEFFLWGLFPKHEVFIDKELVDSGAETASSVMITNSQSMKNTLWTLFTFGVYYPQTFTINAKIGSQ